MRPTLGLFFSACLVTLTAGARADQTLADVNGFDNYNLTTIAGQTVAGDAIGTGPTWTAPTAGLGLPGTIVVDTTGANRGKVLSLDPVGTSGGDVSAAYLPLGADVLAAQGFTQIVIDFDQYRNRSQQSLTISERPSLATSSWVGLEYGPEEIPSGSPGGPQSQKFYPAGTPGAGQAGLPINDPVTAPESWHHFHIILDYSLGMVTATLDGTAGADYMDGLTAGPVPFDLSNGKRFDSIGFQVSGGQVFAAGVPVRNYIDNLVVSGRGGTNVIPEPSSVALLVSGLAALAPLARRRRKA